MRSILAAFLTLLIVVAVGCDSNTPTNSPHQNRPLAGGGRFESDDPFVGGPGGSGSTIADSAGVWDPGQLPYPLLEPLLMSGRDCDGIPQQDIIRDSSLWVAWWDAHTSCLWRCGGDSTDPGPIGDSSRCHLPAPVVDFSANSVIAISIEYDSGAFCMRDVWVTGLEQTETATVITYEVTGLDSSCCALMMRPMIEYGGAAVVALLVPEALDAPPVWIRHDTAFSCSWEPDPGEPLTLYYTDAPCDLGPGETLITDSATWTEWYQRAWSCDSARWDQMWDSTISWPGEDSTWADGTGGDTVLPQPGTDPLMPFWMPSIDFSQFAVVILRAGDQGYWGGGVWLSKFDSGESGTDIDYTIMEPSANCPLVDPPGTSVNPTVAIRVPLTSDAPIIWHRTIETIDCDWGVDSSWVGPDGSTGP